jgi:hypothetical protein
MTHRTVAIVFLFFAALATTGLGLAVVVSLATRFGGTPGPWLVPLLMFLSYVGIFFLAREIVLPPVFAASAARSVVALSVWMGVTLLAAATVTWALGPLLAARGWGRPTVLILLGCTFVSATLLDRLAAKFR